MYHLKLVKGSNSYNFLKFTTNFYFIVFSESEKKPQPETDLTNSLKIQMDLKSAEETIQLKFDLAVLEHLSKLIDMLAKINLEKDEYFESVALKTEEVTNTQIWHKYLPSADQYFKDLKSFIHEDEWKVIANALSADTRITLSE
jgi:hypothetical protein